MKDKIKIIYLNFCEGVSWIHSSRGQRVNTGINFQGSVKGGEFGQLKNY
jgi:hypothetical protein